jgi:hypothetical protein
MRIRCFAMAVICFLGLSLGAQRQRGAKRGMQFLGRIQAVDTARNTVTVKHGPIPGYTGRGTDDYSVDDLILKRLQPGDDIRATVYPNDRALYNVKVVYRNSEDNKSGK